MKYKVGDKVKVRSREWWDKHEKNGDVLVKRNYSNMLFFTKGMTDYCRETVTIASVCHERDSYKIEEDNMIWEWCDGMFEPAYTYADLDLPDWWYGRPILGYVSDESEDAARAKTKMWWVWPNFYNDKSPFIGKEQNSSTKATWKYFVPAEQESRKVCITVKENGESKEIELTEAQIKQLGL